MPDTHLPSLSEYRPIGSDAAVLAELTDVVRQVLEDRTMELSPETAIDELAGRDSMSHSAILVGAECRFDVTFELPDIDAMPMVGHLVRLIRAKRSAGCVGKRSASGMAFDDTPPPLERGGWGEGSSGKGLWCDPGTNPSPRLPSSRGGAESPLPPAATSSPSPSPPP